MYRCISVSTISLLILYSEGYIAAQLFG